VTKPLTAWSYSRYAKYQLCPLQFKLEVLDGNKQPMSPAMQRGDTIHRGVAAFLVDKGPLPPEAEKHSAFIAEVKTIPDKLVEHQQGFTSAWEPTGWFHKTTWYRQVYDVAVLYEDMTSEVVDWKTGKKYATNEEQMELCALSLMCQLKPTTHVTTRLFYIDTGQEEFAEFPASDREKLKAKWNAKVQPMFSDTVFAPRPNEKCRFCAFSRSSGGQCRFG
jgi:CRISPR/Cas system-associated exonuclease Cas4 (RecB family)